jgi:hypothetical protein
MNEAVSDSGIPDPYFIALHCIDVSDPRKFEADVHWDYFARPWVERVSFTLTTLFDFPFERRKKPTFRAVMATPTVI